MFGFHKCWDYSELQIITRQKCWFPRDNADEDIRLQNVSCLYTAHWWCRKDRVPEPNSYAHPPSWYMMTLHSTWICLLAAWLLKLLSVVLTLNPKGQKVVALWDGNCPSTTIFPGMTKLAGEYCFTLPISNILWPFSSQDHHFLNHTDHGNFLAPKTLPSKFPWL